MKLLKIALTCVVLVLAGAPRVYAQAPLDVARDLYATADYEKALTLLDDMIARSETAQIAGGRAVSRAVLPRARQA